MFVNVSIAAFAKHKREVLLTGKLRLLGKELRFLLRHFLVTLTTNVIEGLL